MDCLKSKKDGTKKENNVVVLLAVILLRWHIQINNYISKINETF